MNTRSALIIFLIALLYGCQSHSQNEVQSVQSVSWAEGAVWYQVFPERFRNGDPVNDPQAGEVPWAEYQQNWRVHPWTADWYKVQPWEMTHTDAFYTVVYQRRFGGDLIGVIEKLDYLKTLGIQAIYFNPVFEAESLHKYDGGNFHHIDDNFGPDPDGDKARLKEAAETADPETWIWTSADSTFLNLIAEAHKRDIKIVIDGVFNHTGTAFFAFRDLRQNQQDSPFAGWYDVTAWDDPSTESDEFDYKGWWNDKTLPEFRETELGIAPGPREYIFHITRRWMDPNGDGDPSDGIDGWRLDAADEVSEAFWEDWHTYMKSINPAAISVAENWKVSGDWIRKGLFDAVMNYPFAYAMLDYFIHQEKAISSEELGQRLETLVEAYGEHNMHRLWNLVESHDTERLASMILNPDRRGFDRDGSLRDNVDFIVRRPLLQERKIHKQIAAFQVCFIGSPLIYYGTEAGMWGADDPDNRKPMLWQDLTYEKEASHPVQGKKRPADENAFDPDMFSFYQTLIQLKKVNSALHHGSVTILDTSSEKDVFGFERKDKTQSILCLFNRNTEQKRVFIDISTKEKTDYKDEMSGETVDLRSSGGNIDIPGNGFKILIEHLSM